MEELARFRQFLNEMDYIENEAYFDNLLKEFDGVKKALIDVARVSLAKASYGYNFDASQVGGFAKDEKWKKYLRADFKDVKSNLSSYINKNYLEDKYWKGDPNKLFAYIKEDIDQIIDSLERWLIVSEREIDGQDLKNEKVKEKYKVVLLEIETIKKAISILEKFKSTLAEDPRSIQENKEKIMAQFNYTKFLKEGGIEKNLQEAGDFGNDPQDRYNYVRKFTADLPDTARTEQMIQNLDDALEDFKMTDEVGEFDQAFVEIMIALGKENELMEGDSLINPEAEEIEATDLDAAADYFDSLAENDDVLDEMIDEAAMVVDDFEVGDKVALNIAYQKANGNERMIPSEFKFRVVDVREVPKGGGGTYQDVSVERMSDGERVSYDNSQLARIEDQEMFGEMEGEVQNEEKEEK